MKPEYYNQLYCAYTCTYRCDKTCQKYGYKKLGQLHGPMKPAETTVWIDLPDWKSSLRLSACIEEFGYFMPDDNQKIIDMFFENLRETFKRFNLKDCDSFIEGRRSE